MCESFTQADNILAIKKKEGWLFRGYRDLHGWELTFERRLFHSPGVYVVVTDGIVIDEFGPYRTAEQAEQTMASFYGSRSYEIVEMKYYDIDRPWETGNRFTAIGSAI